MNCVWDVGFFDTHVLCPSSRISHDTMRYAFSHFKNSFKRALNRLSDAFI